MIHTTHNPERRGFTLVELLVVILIITILLGIGAVGLTQGRRSAIQAGATEQLRRIDNACEAFKGDFNDYPPLVTIEGKSPFEASQNGDRLYRPDYQRGNESAADVYDRLAENRFASRYSLAVYLLGIGDLNGDGMRNYGEVDRPNEDDGLDGPGMRAIGKDKFWGLAQDPDRDSVANSGRTYGPYLDPSDLGKLLVEERPTVNSTTGLFVINDPFGFPVLYYRNWVTRDNARQPTVFRAPAELRSLESLAAQQAGNKDSALDIDRQLLGASYALMSAGLNNAMGSIMQDFDADLDLSNNLAYAALRADAGDNHRVFK